MGQMLGQGPRGGMYIHKMTARERNLRTWFSSITMGQVTSLWDVGFCFFESNIEHSSTCYGKRPSF